MLVAAAQETGLLAQLEAALARCSSEHAVRLAHLSTASRQMLVLTLLFLGVVGLRRTWDLRGYTGDALALLSGRSRAYGYWHVERLLTQFAHAGAAQALTTVLGNWTTQLWEPADQQRDAHPPRWYVDGHRKPVYTKRGHFLTLTKPISRQIPNWQRKVNWPWRGKFPSPRRYAL